MKACCGYLLILVLMPAFAAIAAPKQATLDLEAHALRPAGQSQGAKFMPPDKVFKFNASASGPHAVRMHWAIAPGYYLYRGRFHFSLSHSGKAALGKPRFPSGVTKTDAYFGKTTIYHHAVDVLVPVQGAARGDTLQLEVVYQGCADAGFCYPPIRRIVKVTLAAQGAAYTANNLSNELATGELRSRQGHLAHLITTSNLLIVMLVFAGLGLMLAFTPCVLPMLPILSGLIVGQRARVSTRRAFLLSLTYVLAMALTYTAAGVAAGLTGANVQAAFQAPWVVAIFSAIFIALALSMFGIYELQMPAVIQTRMAGISNRQRSGTLVGAGTMGVLSALIVGPCLAAPLAGTLLVIGHGGDPVRGGLALFALSIGMGVPLLAVGASAGRLMPQAGPWMSGVKKIFGVLLLGTAIWFLSRILPGPLTLALWGLLAVIVALASGVLRPGRTVAKGWLILSRSLEIVVLVYGLAMVIGASAGGSDPWQPLAPLVSEHTAFKARSLAFKRIKSVHDLYAAVTAAANHNQSAMLDFYADWCVSCKEMEHTTFQNPRVRRALQGVVLLRADVTADDAKDQALLKHFGIFGPPSIMFFDRKGAEIKQDRVVGYLSAAAFLPHIPTSSSADSASQPAVVSSNE